MGRILRYLAPNLVTAIGLLFGLLSVVAAHEHRFVDAAWLILWAVLVDRIDGFVARLLRATSGFGMQMDSFADFLNFGCAPAFLMYVSLADHPAVGLAGGAGRGVLVVACVVWVLATVVRLARFNIVADSAEEGAPRVFFGMPSTLGAGIIVVWYLVFLKYAGPDSALGAPTPIGGPSLFGGWQVPPEAFRPFPAAMLVVGLLMVSNLPMPKLGRLRSRGLTVVMLCCVAAGYVMAFAKTMPEIIAWMPTIWLVGCVYWGVFDKAARNLQPPPLFAPSPAAIGVEVVDDEDENDDPLVEVEQGR